MAIEIRLKATVKQSDLRHVEWLGNTIGPDLIDSAVTTTGTDAYRRSDGIAVIPAALLTA